jgi:hypothetical protein
LKDNHAIECLINNLSIYAILANKAYLFSLKNLEIPQKQKNYSFKNTFINIQI